MNNSYILLKFFGGAVTGFLGGIDLAEDDFINIIFIKINRLILPQGEYFCSGRQDYEIVKQSFQREIYLISYEGDCLKAIFPGAE